jgi:antitoxin (DNA-binding transcriptional repressor) of toxin-antitoxin stability system
MSQKTVDISTTQADLAELLASLTAGSEILLTKGDTPIAYLVPASSPPSPRIAGLHPGSMQASEDFDRPLPDAFWTGKP